MIALALVMAVLAADTPAAAAAAKAPAAKEAKANKDGLVCRKEAVIGSRMKSRVCLTQAEWDQRQADSRQDLDAAQRNRPLVSN